MVSICANSNLIKVNSIPLLALIIILISSSPHNVEAYDLPDLYSPVDDVIRLNVTTFAPTVFGDNKNITYMVQFYNTFCGHCQMFAPVYKDLGSRVKNWTTVFRLAAIDCSKDENVVTCSDNKIDGYPTIFIFPPNAKQNNLDDVPLNLRSLKHIEWNVDDIEDTVVDYLANLTTTTNREYPLIVNALQPITKSNVDQLRRLYPSNIGDNNNNNNNNNQENVADDSISKQDFMIIVENEKSYLGRKLIIEYYRINSKLELRRILLSNKELLKSLLTSEDFARLDDNQPILIKLGGLTSEGFSFRKAQVLVKGEEKGVLPTAVESERLDYIYNRFKMFFEHYYSIELETEGNTNRRPSNFNNPLLPLGNNEIQSTSDNELEIQHMLQTDPSIRDKIFAIDLLKSISYMITHEIKIKGDLSPIEFNTVRNMLTLFKKYLPLEKWDSSVYKFIDEMRTRLDDNRSEFGTNGMRAQEMRDILDLSGADEIRLRYNKENWVSCHESDRHQKGYTCSLWLLFHSLTLGEYSKAAPVRTKPTMVLETMRDYITRFLGCTVCSSNFAKESESIGSSLTSRNSSIFWLWYTHNKVNQRLNNEKPISDRKSLIDVLFPKIDNCQKCLKTDVREIGVDGKTLDDIKWDMDKVLAYLMLTYKPDKIVTPIEMKLIMRNLKNKFNYDVVSRLDGNESGFEGLKPSPYGADLNKSTVDQWNLQSIFTTSDMGLCLLLYLACIMIVGIVCMALNPKLKRYKTK